MLFLKKPCKFSHILNTIRLFENKKFYSSETYTDFGYLCSRKDGRVVDCIGLENRRL